MVRHTLKISQQMLPDQSMSDHFGTLCIKESNFMDFVLAYLCCDLFMLKEVLKEGSEHPKKGVFCKFFFQYTKNE